jgi:Arc/MetJ-type ribon-helix-helix transcriptional regulator
MGEGRTHVSVRVEDELLDWVDKQVAERIFSNRSHALNRALYLLKQTESSKAASKT